MYYKIKHTKQEINIIYSMTDNKDTQSRLMSLLAYYKKYSDDKGNLIYSLNRLHKMYIRYHKSITRSYFYKLMNDIKEKFFTPCEDNLKDIEEVAIDVDIAEIEPTNTKPNNTINKNYNTNTIKGNKVVSKSDLIKIAKSLFVSNSVYIAVVQNKVLAKIRNSKQKINISGAIRYIETIIMDKLSEWDSQNSLQSALMCL